MHDSRAVIFRKVRQLTSLRNGTLPAWQRMRWQLAAETALAALDDTQRATVATAWDGSAPGFEDTLAIVAPDVREGLVFRYNPDELTFEDEDEDDEDEDYFLSRLRSRGFLCLSFSLDAVPLRVIQPVPTREGLWAKYG